MNIIKKSWIFSLVMFSVVAFLEVAATLLLEMVPRRGKVWRPTSVSGMLESHFGAKKRWGFTQKKDDTLW
jgi:hypothetical protein